MTRELKKKKRKYLTFMFFYLTISTAVVIALNTCRLIKVHAFHQN